MTLKRLIMVKLQIRKQKTAMIKKKMKIVGITTAKIAKNPKNLNPKRSKSV